MRDRLIANGSSVYSRLQSAEGWFTLKKGLTLLVTLLDVELVNLAGRLVTRCSRRRRAGLNHLPSPSIHPSIHPAAHLQPDLLAGWMTPSRSSSCQLQETCLVTCQAGWLAGWSGPWLQAIPRRRVGWVFEKNFKSLRLINRKVRERDGDSAALQHDMRR